ncbi:hybrid sensor histidine kinase/response regulator [Kineobactrum salinum]|uniref:histidine kinase n=1 Tax=Kineobactrum salinum TaxID=2708301 RepID=A0A6C0U383_9GAMM|nr:PAS domain S-box protein [Kineobactrum salinum]QIB64825.1 PAS domain S-box protein [Kineobactrum salinum]
MKRPMLALLRIDPRQWQLDLFRLILWVSVIAGLLVYLPSMYAAYQKGTPGIAAVNTAAIVALAGLYLLNSWSYRWRAGIFCLVFYFLATGLLVYVGPVSQIYLVGFSLLTTLLLGLRAGILTLILNAITLLTLGLLGHASAEMVLLSREAGAAAWVTITLNFVLINSLLVLAIGSVISVLNDALQREVAARTSLEAERSQLRTLVDALPDAVFTKDAVGHYNTCNPMALSQLGLSHKEEVIGKTVFELFPPEFARVQHEEDRQLMSGELQRSSQERWTETNGRKAWFFTIKVPLHNADGTVSGLIGISREITSRKLAELERSRLLARLQLQIERMPLAYLLSDSNFCYSRWNPAAERMFGFSEAEVLHRHPFDVMVPPQSQAWMGGILEQVRAGSMEAHGECEIRTREGDIIICEWHNTPLYEESGEFIGLLSLAQDITGRKNLEGQLQQSQKMEAMGRLAGGVAHDFNNLLTVINGYSEALLQQAGQQAAVLELAGPIHEAGERAAALTRQLLSFSRQTIMQPRVLDLNTIVTDTGKMLQRLIGEDIQFTTVLAPDLHRVRVDPGQLDQVLINLAVNARDAMPSGGWLTLETANVTLSEDYAARHPDCKPGPHVMLAMSDTGAGMADEIMEHIFEPFFTTKGIGKGSGLGLAIVFGIVQQSNGCIHVYSESGHGTTFKIYLPAISDAVLPEVSSDPAPGPGGGETILLVEDEEEVRVLAARSLRDRGYQVLAAVDGHDAVAAMEAHGNDIDLLLTDVVMPNLGGRELMELFRQRFPRAGVIFMSGYTDDAVFRHGLLSADADFIQKPYTPSSLAAKVRAVLDARAVR